MEKDGLTKEIGGLCELTETIIKKCGLNERVVRKIQIERRGKRGCYAKKIYLETIKENWQCK